MLDLSIQNISSARCYTTGKRGPYYHWLFVATFLVYTGFEDLFSHSIVQYGLHANPFQDSLSEENRRHKRKTSIDK